MLTRSRKGSLVKDNLTLQDIPALIRESEERIKNFLKTEIEAVNKRLDKFEASLFSVKANCDHLGNEITTIKEVIIDQQLKIESHEAKLRSNNIIVHNIPEDPVFYGPDKLEDDKSKMSVLCHLSDVKIKADDMSSFQRLGKRQQNKNRPLKVTLKNSSQKFQFLNNRGSLSKSNDLMHIFKAKIFVNADSSFLVQKEEYRLRQKLKDLKRDKPHTSSYIRSGVLYHGGKEVDRVNIKNQLF